MADVYTDVISYKAHYLRSLSILRSVQATALRVAAPVPAVEHAARGDAGECLAADVGRGAGTPLVELGEPGLAVHAPFLAAAEGRSVPVAVETRALEALCKTERSRNLYVREWVSRWRR